MAKVLTQQSTIGLSVRSAERQGGASNRETPVAIWQQHLSGGKIEIKGGSIVRVDTPWFVVHNNEAAAIDMLEVGNLQRTRPLAKYTPARLGYTYLIWLNDFAAHRSKERRNGLDGAVPKIETKLGDFLSLEGLRYFNSASNHVRDHAQSSHLTTYVCVDDPGSFSDVTTARGTYHNFHQSGLVNQCRGSIPTARAWDPSSALSRTIDLLAKHHDVQAKLRAEIREAYKVYGKNLDYDQLNSLPYLDADWTLPLQYPVRSQDGKITISNIYIPKGTCLHVSLGAANRDERIWGNDAREFKPSRWLEPLPASAAISRMPGIYSSIMTFLVGPRACPGVKFAQLEMKAVLSSLASSFKFDPSEEDKVRWKNDAIAKSYSQHPDRTMSKESMMPIRVTVLGESE
ncbi:cytochrome P450 [Rhizoctonia solani]|nr:cytochrome P450 [Rhizoctonia solani]